MELPLKNIPVLEAINSDTHENFVAFFLTFRHGYGLKNAFANSLISSKKSGVNKGTRCDLAPFLVGSFWFCLNHDENRIANPCYTHYAFSVSEANFELLSQKIISNNIPIFKENTSPGKSLYFLDPDGHKLEIHLDNWQTRIEIKKKDLGKWKNVEWFI